VPVVRGAAFSAVIAGLLANGAVMAGEPQVTPVLQVCDGDPLTATTTENVCPGLGDPWQSRDAGFECVTQLGYDFGLKIDGWSDAVNGLYSGCLSGQGQECDPEFTNTITITENDGTYFPWMSSPFSLRAVIAKGGNAAHVFPYAGPDDGPSGVFADTDLYQPINNSGKPAAVSHATFCWNKGDDAGDEECYQDETAWAVGSDYNIKGGNWAMYVDYDACDEADGAIDGVCTTDLRADGGDGVGMDAGTATLASIDDEYVKITINLENTFIFYYDLQDDQEDNNLKVQHYVTAPEGDPKVGRFAYKAFIPVGSRTGEFVVPANNFYGIHLDLAYIVPCEQ
jgi:hypothetical protein